MRACRRGSRRRLSGSGRPGRSGPRSRPWRSWGTAGRRGRPRRPRRARGRGRPGPGRPASPAAACAGRRPRGLGRSRARGGTVDARKRSLSPPAGRHRTVAAAARPLGHAPGAAAAGPVADARGAALVEGAEEIARDWLVELVGAPPLATAASLPIDTIAADGPHLVAAIAFALASDADLARLERSGDLRPAAAAAHSGDAAATLAATESLRRAVWSATLAASPRAPASLVADLADRLARVCSEVATAALEAGARPPDRLASLAARELGDVRDDVA